MTAGMDGVVPEGFDARAQAGMPLQANAAQASGMLAGPLPGNGALPAGFGAGDPMNFGAGMNQANGMGMMGGFDGVDAPMFGMMDYTPRQGVRAAARNRARMPHQPARKSTKKPTTAKRPAAAHSTGR
jgi:hypothetical protein